MNLVEIFLIYFENTADHSAVVQKVQNTSHEANVLFYLQYLWKYDGNENIKIFIKNSKPNSDTPQTVYEEFTLRNAKIPL